MSARPIVLVGGGVRSGKSAFALERGQTFGPRRVFVATAEGHDDDMRARIARHRAERDASFETIEEPLHLPELLARVTSADVVIVDCLTLWLSNLLLRGFEAERIRARACELVAALAGRAFAAVIVTNEVGMGVVPDSALGRAFRDLSGMVHQDLARVADEIYFGALGTTLRLKPAPVAMVSTPVAMVTEGSAE